MSDEPCPTCAEAPDHHRWECYPPLNHAEYARLIARHATLDGPVHGPTQSLGRDPR